MSALDIGIDLGTTKTIIYKQDEGIILSEPSIVAINTREDTIVAIGQKALDMFERTPPYITVTYPLNDGVVSDYILTEYLLKEFLKKACNNFLIKHRIVICIPSLITNVQKRSLVEIVENSGGRKVYLIEEPIAAAIGCGLDITRAHGNFIVDIGGGTTDIAVISMLGIVVSNSIKYAGRKVDEDISRLLSNKYKLSIGLKMAEQIKKEIGNLFNPSNDITISVKGRDMLTGLPKMIILSEIDIYEALIEFGVQLISAIKTVLEQTPPELIGDIHAQGIILTGGCSLIKGITELITQCTNVRAFIAENPVECVAIGTAKSFQYIGKMQNGFSTQQNSNSKL